MIPRRLMIYCIPRSSFGFGREFAKIFVKFKNLPSTMHGNLQISAKIIHSVNQRPTYELSDHEQNKVRKSRATVPLVTLFGAPNLQLSQKKLHGVVKQWPRGYRITKKTKLEDPMPQSL